MVDVQGRALCSHAVWGRRCRWGKCCEFSHDVPPELAACLRDKARAQTEAALVRRVEEAPDVEVPGWLRELQARPCIFEFDTQKWPLREAAEAALEVRQGSSLEELHLRALEGEPPTCPVLLEAFGTVLGRTNLPLAWAAASEAAGADRAATLRTAWRSDAHRRFLQLYDAFVAEVLAPALCPGGAVLAQRPPCVRVHLSGQRAAKGKIGMHKDSDYPGHCEAEINFWVPLTCVGGANSLYVESAPGLGDFTPLEMEYGQVYRFYGYGCRHHTMANETASTRVSFDTRLAPADCCPEAALRGPRRGARGMRIGDYGAARYEAVQSRASEAGCDDGIL
mmetsp:Transcript_131621/g.421244  ORF Transcript_131621/g.421244 Transcript_131621/m.421244 type:complete len:337 (+) Transcript_131621:153-1163(+)